MHIVETEVFTIDELDDKAKARARDWCREGFDWEWWEGILDNAREIGAVLGFDISHGRDGIAFSGFSNQGDGASFTGTWSPPQAPVANMRKLGFGEPVASELLGFAREAWEITRKLTKDERAEAPFTVSRSGRYSHEMTMRCERDDVLELARDFTRWIYCQLETEWDYMNSDGYVDDHIRANEYTFTVDGKQFG